MAYAKDTIKLGAAQLIFAEYQIEVITVGGRTAGYSAVVNGQRLEDTGLTRLCQAIVEKLTAAE